LILAPVTLYLFLFGGLVSLIWCIVGLIIIIMGETPRTRIFPEIDVITMIARTEGENLPWSDSAAAAGQSSPFADLRDANEFEIRNRLAMRTIRVPVQAVGMDVLLDRGHSTRAQGGGSRLSGRPHSEQSLE